MIHLATTGEGQHLQEEEVLGINVVSKPGLEVVS